CRSSITEGGADTPEQFSEDCAQCSDDLHKVICGSYTTVKDSACPPPNVLGCNDCSSCLEADLFTCDHERLVFSETGSRQASWCCQSGGSDCFPSGATPGEYYFECGPGVTAGGTLDDRCSGYPVGFCLQGY